jgi:hypothetical protein
MELNKFVSNPMLVGSIELIKSEDSPRNRQVFIEELVKAQFLTPGQMDPMPVVDEDGKWKLLQGTKINFPMLTTVTGKKFFMAFTDQTEYELWAGDMKDQFPLVTMTLQDYAGLIFHKDEKGHVSPASGFAINPASANVVIPVEMMAGLIAAGVIGKKQE